MILCIAIAKVCYTRMVPLSWETLLLDLFWPPCVPAVTEIAYVLNGDVSVVYSVCECNVLMSTLAC